MLSRQTVVITQQRRQRSEGEARPGRKRCEGCVHVGAARQLAAIADFGGDAMVRTTPEGLIQKWSKGAKLMYGYAPREVLRRPLSVLVLPGHIDELWDMLHRAATGPGIVSQETVHLCKDGRRIDVALAIWTMQDGEGKPSGYSIVARNITGLKRDVQLRAQQERQVQESAERARTAQRRLRDSQRELAAARETASLLDRYRGLFISAPQACLVTDAEGMIREANAAAGTLLAFEPARLAGLPLAGFMAEEERRILRNRLGDLRRARGAQQWEFRIRPHTRPAFDALVSAVFVRDPAGGPSLVQWCLCDVTALAGRQSALFQENNRLTGELIQARSALARASHEIETLKADYAQFVSAACHDLRSPLLSIAGSIRLLMEQSGNEPGGHFGELAGTVEKGVARLGAMIAGLSKYARIGTADMEVVACDLNILLQEVLAEMEPPADVGPMDFSPDVLPTVRADRNLLKGLLKNLLDNAVKFRGPQPPRVRVNAHEEGHEWVVSVQDNGIGIDPCHFEGVFLVFQRLHAEDASYPGIGLGLAVCRRIVERHNGRIWVESQPGQGATFHFSLPK